MQRLTTNSRGIDRFRIGAWKGDGSIALLSPKPGTIPTPDGIARALEQVRRRGFQTALTPALAATEREPFDSCGFALHERLHLLSHDLTDIPGPEKERPGIRRGRRRDINPALQIDSMAFEPFWRLTSEGLSEARLATPRSRFRVIESGARLLGYHVTGCAGSAGYLQRLAVHPGTFGQGHGTDLVHDCLRWVRHQRCTIAFVNTQETNQRALKFYEWLGFILEPQALAVLRYDFDLDEETA